MGHHHRDAGAHGAATHHADVLERARLRGRGLSFEELRRYVPGDDVRTIDWNVTARVGQPFIKRFVDEGVKWAHLDIAGMVWFAVRPGIEQGVPHAVLNGALLGALCYATYDLTNQATMKVWPASITAIDIAWGAAATALASGLAAFAVRKLGML